MHSNIVKHNIKKSACLLTATLLQTSRSMLVSAKTVTIRGTSASLEAGSTKLPDGFNFPELIHRIGDDLYYEWLNISFVENGTINEGDVWELVQNYTLTISDIDLNGEKVTPELAKNSDVVDFSNYYQEEY